MRTVETQYAELLSGFLKHPDPAALEEIRALGKKLLKKQCEPVDIVHLHRECLRGCAMTPGAVTAEEYDQSMAFLSEALRSYTLDPLRPLLESSVTSHFVAQVLRELENQAAISDVGRMTIGRCYAENIQGDLDNCLQIFQMQGLGELRLVSTKEEDGEVVLEGDGLFESIEKSPYPQDHFTRGFLAAIVSRLAGQGMNCEEVACQGRDDPFCRFVVSAVELGGIDHLQEKLSRVS